MSTKIAALKFDNALIQKIEIISGIVLTIVAIFFHLIFLQQAGAFWRDEVNSINLATMPSIYDTWHYLNYDSFPILLSLILRAWTAIGIGSEWGLKLFGLLVGVSILGALWLNGRLMGYRVPLLSIGLFALNPISIRFGDSVRPYGLGVLLLLLAIGFLWKVTEQGRIRHTVIAAVISILSVQCLYQNAFFLVSAIFAGIVLNFRKKDWKKILSLFAIGVFAAVSLLPYLPIIKESGQWAIIRKSPADFELIWYVLSEALSTQGWIVLKIWIIVAALGIYVSIYRQIARQKSDISVRKDIALFCLITMLVYAVMLLLFLRFLSFPIRSWYYLPLMALAAVSLDAIFSDSNLWSISKVILGVSIAAVAFNVNWQTTHVRQTNIDIAASILEKSAKSDDLIVVNPWYLAVSFQRYYHGPADFITLPPIGDHNIHRYDLIKAKMTSVDPIQPVLAAVSETMKSGHCVWIVGWGSTPLTDSPPASLPPAPHSAYGWSDIAYTTNWEQQFMYFILSHSNARPSIQPITKERINSLENCSLVMFRGWRE